MVNMEKVADILGIKLDEGFRIAEVEGLYFISSTSGGLYRVEDKRTTNMNHLLLDLLRGGLTISVTWEPLEGHHAFYPDARSDSGVSMMIWSSGDDEKMRIKNRVGLYRTETGAAAKAKDMWYKIK